MDPGVLVPPYRLIADRLRARIVSGDLRPGDRIPSARAIVRNERVAIATAMKALAVLRDQGLTVARVGVGTVVARTPDERRGMELTRDRVVHVAIELADREGLAELNMRRVASELGVATMSIYGHVPSKSDLVVAMIDTALGEIEIPARMPSAWRPRLDVAARLQWEAYRRHPWLSTSMSLTRPEPSRNGMLLSEWVLAALEQTVLSLSERMYVNMLLFSFLRGIAGALEPEAEAERETGMTGDQWVDDHEHRYAELVEGMPNFQRFAAEPFDSDLDSLFEFGLERFLDGIAVLLARRSRA